MGLFQLTKPHTFVLGDYHKADVEEMLRIEALGLAAVAAPSVQAA